MKPEFYPHHNPYGPEWPDAHCHPDWPHYRHMHHWNDTEPAAVVPWHDECCPEPSDDCVCVTSGDVLMWNKISGVSALADINIDGLSGLSALSGISELLPAVSAVNAYSAIWMSAEYVPDIYDDIAAMSAKIDTKAPLSAEYLQRVYADERYFNGAGTMKSVLRLSEDMEAAYAIVYESSDKFTKMLVNTDKCDEFQNAMEGMYSELSTKLTTVDWSINDLYNKIKDLPTPTATNNWENKKVSLNESKKNPNLFYYYDSLT